MEEIYLVAGIILLYLIYNLFVPPQYKKSDLLAKTNLRSLFRS